MLSREFLLERGYCCGHGCLMCPYEPKHIKNNTDVAQHCKLCEKNNCNYLSVEYNEFTREGGYQLAINAKPKFIQKYP